MSAIKFTRKQINEWPKRVYLADLGDGDGCRPYQYIQRPDYTTPKYVRADLYNAALAEVERLRDALTAIDGLCADFLTEPDAEPFRWVNGVEVIRKLARHATPIACQSGEESEIACEDE